MNLIKTLCFIALIIAYTSCHSNKETVAETTPVAETPAPPPEASQGQSRGNNPERQAAYEAMVDSLQMTEKQREDFDFITTKYRAQMQQLRQKNEGNFEAMRPAMMELREKQNAELKEVLSEDQFAQYQKWQEVNRGRKRQGGPPGN